MPDADSALVADPGSDGAVSAVEGSTAASAMNPGEGGGSSMLIGGGGGGGDCGFAETSYTSVRLGYAQNGRAVTFAHGESWCWDGQTSCPVNGSYQITWAREFRYDGARARYLNRQLNAPSFQVGSLYELDATWTDYDGAA